MKLWFVAGLLLAAAPAYAQSFYVSNQDGGVTRIDGASLAITGSLDLGKNGPRGIAVTQDGKLLVTANQATGDISLIDRASLKLQGRIAVGPAAEMVRVLDGTAYVTHEPKHDPTGRAYIALADLANMSVLSKIASGHETEGMTFSPDGKSLIVANEGDNTVSVYGLPGGALQHSVSTTSYGDRPRGVTLRPNGQGYVVSLEFSDKVLVLDASFNVVKAVPVGQGPYGVAFSPDGSKLFVAASKAGLIQAFDAKSFAKLGEAAVGKRCWHFSFTQDGGKLLAACGRSDAVYVVDTAKMAQVKIIPGLKTPWGIVAYPVSAGTLQ
jgi:YVTN family beta-propeller protein